MESEEEDYTKLDTSSDDNDNFDSESEEYLESDGELVLGLEGSGNESQSEAEVEDSLLGKTASKFNKESEDYKWSSEKKDFFASSKKKGRKKNKFTTEAQLLEEKTAFEYQEKIFSQLKGVQSSDLLPEKDSQSTSKKDDVEIDVDSMNRKERLHLLNEQSPELMQLFTSIREKFGELQERLYPILEAMRNNSLVIPTQTLDYVRIRYAIITNILCSANAYMMLKSAGVDMKTHDASLTLAKYEHLLQELHPLESEQNIAIDAALSSIGTGIKRRTTVQKAPAPTVSQAKKAPVKSMQQVYDSLHDSNLADEEEEEEEMEGMDDERRAITNKIKKNRGLVPYRKKAEKNPRVKYRRKYKKKIRNRKSQFQGHKKEFYRYSGEVTGIKSHLVKSKVLK